ncbi:MAG: 4'-phosphopantetheinyl transferase superfamily protein [Calditrichaeota bacterium]|nr:MAG: 4'-phosphopantetheinyl transferase superfamily protein [Calditrichota bacterium]
MGLFNYTKCKNNVIYPNWNQAKKNLILGRNEVHVWYASLEQSKNFLYRLSRTLSVQELQRAQRFYFQKDREHYIIAHGILRDILSRYLKIEPTQLNFYCNPFGKPYLTENSGGQFLKFNLSHSDGIAMYAIAHNREVGIDVERIRPDFASEQIAERFFSQQEIAILRSLPENLQVEGFFNCWTRKEAFIKAIGQGLSFGLDKFAVSLTPEEPARLLNVYDCSQKVRDWVLEEISFNSHFKAAIAVQGNQCSLKKWQWCP